jgi:tripartite-type tricarboxylate transporter receptor subunit TctC
VKALQDAFDKTVRDPAFIEEARKAQLELDPVSGEELQRIVADILATPEPAARRLAELLAEGTEQKK